jgi:hypothetical protein
LGERLLCKQEVVGSIPSGSTSGSIASSFWISSVKKLSHRFPAYRRRIMCVLSDIVKRRSFRAERKVTSVMLRFAHSPNVSATQVAGNVMLMKLDRLIIGSVLSKLVFLISDPAERIGAGTQPQLRIAFLRIAVRITRRV